MDAEHFDIVTRTLASAPTRRRTLGLLGGLGLARLLGRSASEAKHKKKKKKKHSTPSSPLSPPPAGCVRDCTGKTCGDDGCGGSCGACDEPTSCRNGVCACPEGQELCGGACLPLCPASSPLRTVVRHPGTCGCCVRPGTFTCPDAPNNWCCVEPDDLPCCAQPCNPLAVDGMCQQWFNYQDNPVHPTICDYDIECYAGNRCGEGPYPRTCDPIPT